MQPIKKLFRASRTHDLVRQIKSARPDLTGQADDDVISTYLNDELIADYWQNVHYQKRLANASAPGNKPVVKPALSKLFEKTLLLTADESMAYYIKLTHQLLFDNQELRSRLASLEERSIGTGEKPVREYNTLFGGPTDRAGQRNMVSDKAKSRRQEPDKAG